MKLLYSLTSPYARKVRVVAAEKRIEVEMVKVVLSDPDCPVIHHNPLGKIPVLILDDGEALFDSRVIVEFLDNRTPVARLIPQDHSAKVWVRRWEALADGVCDAAIAAMQESRRAENMRDQAIIEKQMGKVHRGCGSLTRNWGRANGVSTIPSVWATLRSAACSAGSICATGSLIGVRITRISHATSKK